MADRLSGKLFLRLDPAIYRNPKLLSVSVEANLLYIRGLAYSKDSNTDGFVPSSVLPLLGLGMTDPSKASADLVGCGLWEPIEGGCTLPDGNWAEWQMTAEEITKRKEAAAERVRKHRERHAVTPDAGECNTPVTRYTDVTPALVTRQEIEIEEEKEKEIEIDYNQSINQREDDASISDVELVSEPLEPDFTFNPWEPACRRITGIGTAEKDVICGMIRLRGPDGKRRYAADRWENSAILGIMQAAVDSGRPLDFLQDIATGWGRHVADATRPDEADPAATILFKYAPRAKSNLNRPATTNGKAPPGRNGKPKETDAEIVARLTREMGIA